MVYTWLFRVGQKQLAQTMSPRYIRQTILYRALYRVLLCYSIQELFYCPTLRTLVHNIRTRVHICNCLTLALTTLSLYSLSSSTFSQEEHCRTLGIRGALVRQGKLDCLLALKPTGAFQMYHLLWTCSLLLSPYQPCATGPLVVCLCRGIVGVLKTLLRLERSSQTKIVYNSLGQQPVDEVVSNCVGGT